MVTAAMKLKDAYPLEEKLSNLDGILKSRDIIFPTNVCLVKAKVFHSHVQMSQLDYKES